MSSTVSLEDLSEGAILGSIALNCTYFIGKAERQKEGKKRTEERLVGQTIPCQQRNHDHTQENHVKLRSKVLWPELIESILLILEKTNYL